MSYERCFGDSPTMELLMVAPNVFAVSINTACASASGCRCDVVLLLFDGFNEFIGMRVRLFPKRHTSGWGDTWRSSCLKPDKHRVPPLPC